MGMYELVFRFEKTEMLIGSATTDINELLECAIAESEDGTSIDMPFKLACKVVEKSDSSQCVVFFVELVKDEVSKISTP